MRSNFLCATVCFSLVKLCS